MVGMAIVWLLNCTVIGIALFIASLGSYWYIQNQFVLEAILFIFVGILNTIAVTVLHKGKLLKIVRPAAIASNAMFILLGVQAIMSNTILGALMNVVALLSFSIAAVNVVAIFTAPICMDQQNMICPECDYDLRGLKNRGCPECGWGRKN